MLQYSYREIVRNIEKMSSVGRNQSCDETFSMEE